VKREDIVQAVEGHLRQWVGTQAKVETITRYTNSDGESEAIATVGEGDARWGVRVRLFADEEPPAIVVIDESLPADPTEFLKGVRG
jgi:hypothetical protein